MGEYFAQKQDFHATIFWYQLALKVPVHYSWSMDKVTFRTWFPHRELAKCYEQLEEFGQAIHHSEQVLIYLPDEEESKKKIQQLIAQQTEQ